MSKRVIELIRVSTEGQAEEDRAGIPAQREINRRTAKVYGLEIVKTIQIVDVSGASVLSSPEMQELLRLMESPDVHGVLAKEFSRLIRPEKFTDYALLQHFIDTGTVLYLPDGPIDLASKTGRLLGTIRAAIAGLERREIIERMNDAKEAIRRAGKHAGGASSLPYGVGYSKERGWHYTAEAEKVKQAFELFLSGNTSYADIGQRLNIPRTSVKFLLENPIYCGWRVYNEKRDPSPLGYVARPDGRQGYRRKIKRSPEEFIRVRVLDGFVSEEDFHRVQQIIQLKCQKHWRAYAEQPNRYTYSSFLTCGDCGDLLYTHTSKYDFYLCKTQHTRERRNRALRGLEPCSNRHMLRAKLEPKIDYLLGAKLREPEFLSRVVEGYNQQLVRSSAPPGVSEQAVADKLAKLAEKRQRVLEAFFEGLVGKKERDQLVGEIDREILVYQRLLERKPTHEGQPIRGVEDLLPVMEPFAEWEFLEREDKRALLAVLCPEIGVYRYTIKTLTLNWEAASRGGYKDDHWRKAPSRLPGRRSR